MINSSSIYPQESENQKFTTSVDIEIFDPPMCCPSGLCGPSLDQTLLDVNEMILKLQKDGVHIERYQMSANPNAFINNPEVMRLVREQQMSALPITVVHGKVTKSGDYPTFTEITTVLNNGRSSA